MLAVAALAVAVQLPFYDRWASFMDEGHMLQFADLIAKGGELYRDATVYPLPGAFYLLALAFRVAGPSVLLARRIVLVEFAVLAACFYLLVRRLLPRPLVAVSLGLLFLYRIWAFPHWQMYSYSSTALCLLALATCALVRSFDSDDLRLVAAAGLAAGLAVLCKQDYGAAGLAAMNAVLLLHAVTAPAPRRRPALLLAWLDGPPLVLGTLIVLHFAREGLLGEMVRLTVWTHLFGMATFDYPSLPRLFPLFHQDPALRDTYAHVVYAPPILFTVDWAGLRASWLYTETALWDIGLKIFFYAPYALVAGGAVRLWRRRGALHDTVARPRFLAEAALFALGAALVLSLNKPRDYVHVAILYWPWLGLLPLYARALADGRRWRALAIGALALALGVPAAAYTARLAWRLRTEHPARLAGARGGIRVKAAEATLLADTVAYVQSHAGPADTVAVLPYFPLISFLADRRGPHRSSYVVWPVRDHPDRDRQIIEAMEAAHTPVVIYSLTQWPQFPPFELYAAPVFDYLVDHFEIDRVFTPDPWGYVLAALSRRRGPPDGTPLALAEGTVRLEGGNGGPRPVDGPDRARWMTPARWPFRPVTAVRPRAGGRTVVTLPVAVPAGARLHTAVAVHPDHWVGYPASWARFTIRGDGRVLFSQMLDPQRDVADRRWVEVDVALDAFAGRTVPLEFAVECERPEAETLETAGWATPRLVTGSPS